MKKRIVLLFLITGMCIGMSSCAQGTEEKNTSRSGASQSSQSKNATSQAGGVSKPGTGADTAEEAARLYLLSAPFSYNRLVQELKNEGFSAEQASAAADSCGADWNMQAERAAKEYLKRRTMTQDGLEEQLKYDGFTDEQAKHGAAQAAQQETTKESSDKEDFIRSVD